MEIELTINPLRFSVTDGVPTKVAVVFIGHDGATARSDYLSITTSKYDANVVNEVK